MINQIISKPILKIEKMWTHYWEFVISQASKKVSVFFKFGVTIRRLE